MLDTIAISQTYDSMPGDLSLWKPYYSTEGKILRYVLDPEYNTHEPRLTLSNPESHVWILRAEVSIPAWLKGSNLHLPNDEEVISGLTALSGYVFLKTGIEFDALNGCVRRSDFTRDFYLGNGISPIIAEFSGICVPKYRRNAINGETVSFRNKAKKLTKKHVIYNKEALVRKSSDDPLEQFAGRGRLRLESSLRGNGVNRAAKSLKLENHIASNFLTSTVSNSVLITTMNELSFTQITCTEASRSVSINDFLNSDDPDVLARVFSSRTKFTTGLSRIGFAVLNARFGTSLMSLPFINVSRSTLFRLRKGCREAGIKVIE